MRTLEFKIHRDKLITKDWSHWKREDQNYIMTKAGDNNIECVEDAHGYDTMTFKGRSEDLFDFLHDVAYRYDIELV